MYLVNVYVVIAVAGVREVFLGGAKPSRGCKIDPQIFFAESTFVRVVSRCSRDFA
jgi:hypothetical protein